MGLKIRVWGKQEECAEAVEKLRDNFNLLAVSSWAKDTRGESQLGRVYIEAEIR